MKFSEIVPKGTLPEQVCRFVADRSVEAYLVGGYVRDRLLGRVSQDLDFAVKGDSVALARQVARRFRGAFVLLDRRRGIARVVLKDEGGQKVDVDFIQLQGEDISEDLAKRDFTINAIAYNLKEGDEAEPIDLHEGREDLQARLVRAVYDDAFRDDPLRTMRAVRHAVELGMRVEARTEELIRKNAFLLPAVSAERIRYELSKILAQPGASEHLRYLDDLNILTILFPELNPTKGFAQPFPHYLDVFAHSLETVRKLENICAAFGLSPACQKTEELPDLEILRPWASHLAAHLAQPTTDERVRLTTLKLIALLHDIGKPPTAQECRDDGYPFYGHEGLGAEMASLAMRNLRFGVLEEKIARIVIANHTYPQEMAERGLPSGRDIYRFFRQTGEAGIDTLLLHLADHLAAWQKLQPERWRLRLEMAAALISAWYEGREAVSPPKLIDGDELMEIFGLEAGPALGEILEAVREAQAGGEVKTKEEALELAQTLLDEKLKVG